MSRYVEGDWDDEYAALNQGRWEHNARVALKGRRGRKALAELREALMALPEHKLIEGAVCTVGAERRKAALVAEAEADHQRRLQYQRQYLAEHPERARYYGPDRGPDLEKARDLDEHIERNGEGVCAVGAYAWYRKVKAGMDPADAFAALPDVADEGDDALGETAGLGKAAGMGDVFPDMPKPEPRPSAMAVDLVKLWRSEAVKWRGWSAMRQEYARYMEYQARAEVYEECAGALEVRDARQVTLSREDARLTAAWAIAQDGKPRRIAEAIRRVLAAVAGDAPERAQDPAAGLTGSTAAPGTQAGPESPTATDDGGSP